MAYTLSSIGNSFAAQQRPAARASRRAGAVRVQAQSDKGEDTVYLGKGRTIKDDPTKYPDRARSFARRRHGSGLRMQSPV